MIIPACDSRPLSISLGNGTLLSFLNDAGDTDIGYGNAKEVVTIRHFDSESNAMIDRIYTYNGAYMRTSKQMIEISGSPINIYSLDSAYRSENTLLDAEMAAGFYTQLDYQLDGAGNRHLLDYLEVGEGWEWGTTYDYISNVMNEYDDAGYGSHRGHDNNGNLTDDGRLFVYDYRNRLIKVKRKYGGALVAVYEYDTDNRRIKRTVNELNISTRRYFYDNRWNVIEEWADDSDYLNNGPVATYVYGAGTDKPLQMETSVSAPAGAGTFYYHQDARNNVVAMTNGNGTVVEKTRYDDFGNFTQDISIENPYLFQGRRYDPETEFFYFRNRYYVPNTGRFIQRDPVWDPDNMGNQYTFVGNNPVTGLDPRGLEDILGTPTMIIGAGPEPGYNPTAERTGYHPQLGPVTVYIDEDLWKKTANINPAFKLALEARIQLIIEGRPIDLVSILIKMWAMDPETAKFAGIKGVGPGIFLLDLQNLLDGKPLAPILSHLHHRRQLQEIYWARC